MSLSPCLYLPPLSPIFSPYDDAGPAIFASVKQSQKLFAVILAAKHVSISKPSPGLLIFLLIMALYHT